VSSSTTSMILMDGSPSFLDDKTNRGDRIGRP
jgi:hypothetical protein